MNHPTNGSRSFPDGDLAQHLDRRADEFDHRGGSHLELGQVLDRAGEIKRGRRMRATGIMAAVVLAVAVPTALVAARGDDAHKPVTPTHHSRTDTSPLTIDGLKTGAAPKTGWFDGKVWTGPDGTQVQVSGGDDPAAVARVGDSLLFAAQGKAGMRVRLVPPVGGGAGAVQSWPIDGAIAVSDDGELGAFVRPDGTPVVIRANGTYYELPQVPRGSGFDAVAVTGDCADGSCAVWVNSHGRDPEVWTSTSTGAVNPGGPETRSVDDVLAGKAVAAMSSATDDGSCSAVMPLDGPPTWSTCDHQLGTFSPDGEHLSAFPAYFDGAGSSELAVLDAATGAVRLDLHTGQDAYVGHAVWEDDNHLLAVVGEGARAAVLRIGLDGSREYAVAPTASEPYVAPFVLPSR
jgi:hypothetical protein